MVGESRRALGGMTHRSYQWLLCTCCIRLASSISAVLPNRVYRIAAGGVLGNSLKLLLLGIMFLIGIAVRTPLGVPACLRVFKKSSAYLQRSGTSRQSVRMGIGTMKDHTVLARDRDDCRSFLGRNCTRMDISYTYTENNARLRRLAKGVKCHSCRDYPR